MENKITIENPCNKNWNAMPANQKGRFCDSCSNTVIDFTKMKHPEIENYFIQNSDSKSICGRYKSTQVANDNDSYSNLRNRFNRIKVRPVKVLALFSLGFLFTFSSCIMGKRAEQQPEGVIENDSINAIRDSIQAVKNDSIKAAQNAIKETK
jgi:hypothetical protein